MMASLAVTLFILLQATSTLAADEMTSASPSNIVNPTLATLQESTSNTKDITTSKASSQDISNYVRLENEASATYKSDDDVPLITAASPSNIVSSTLATLQESTSNTTDITTSKASSQDISNYVRLENEASATYKSDDDAALMTVSPVRVDDEDISATSSTSGATHNVTPNNTDTNDTFTTYDTTSNNKTKPQTTAIVPLMPVSVTKTREEDNKNVTLNYSEKKTQTNAKQPTRNDSSTATKKEETPSAKEKEETPSAKKKEETPSAKEKKKETPNAKEKKKETPKPAAWILPTLLSIVVLCLVVGLVHEMWENRGKKQPRRSTKDRLRNGICGFRVCLRAQNLESQRDEELGEAIDAGETGAEGNEENRIKSGFGGGEEGAICNGADKLEGGCNVTFEETKL